MSTKRITIVLVALALVTPWNSPAAKGDGEDLQASWPLDGIWVSSVPTPLGNLVLTTTYVAQDAAKTQYSGSLEEINQMPLLVELYPNGDSTKWAGGQAALVGLNKYEATYLGYSVRGRESNLGLEEIVGLFTINAHFELIGPDFLQGNGTGSYYVAAQDADQDGFPDEGQTPVACIPWAWTGRRLAPLPGCIPNGTGGTENLLENGGFEEGLVQPWSIYGPATTGTVVQELTGAPVPEPVIEGSNCLYVHVPNQINPVSTGLIYSGLVFEKGKKYTFSAFIKGKSTTQGVNFKVQLDGEPYTSYGELATWLTEEWTEYSVTTPVFTEDVSPAGLVIHIGWAVGGFWIDNVKFYEGDYIPSD